MKFSLAAQIEEIDRELEQRAKVYPSLVKSRGMGNRLLISTSRASRPPNPKQLPLFPVIGEPTST
jgi:hypothetical protein